MYKRCKIVSNKIYQAIRNPAVAIEYLAKKGCLRWMSDKVYVRILYKGNIGKKLNLSDPKTFNEKLQWLKLYDHKDIYTQLVDKFLVREFVKEKIGENYLIPLLGKWDKAEEIDIKSLPEQFVLKCNHDSGSIIVCREKDKFDLEDAKKKLSYRLKNGTYWYTREWPYKNVIPCIIAEKYMEDDQYHDLRDYKFLCFDGIPKVMYIATERMNPDKPTAFDFFDMEFNHLPVQQAHPNAERIPSKPINYNKMIEFAKILAKGFPHVRIDFYEINGEVYFGEMTFYHMGGISPFIPETWDYTFGSWLNLPDIENKQI